MNLGEEICGEWLRHMQGCDFIQYNIATKAEQGEIDVIGINLEEKRVYACEVAIHLETGLQYTKNSQPDNVARFKSKFGKDIRYLRSVFPEQEYEHVIMLWSPIVKSTKPGSKHNQARDIEEISIAIENEFAVKVEVISNERFNAALSDLRAIAGKESKALESPVLRYLQIEEKLKKHLRLKNK